MSFFHHLFRLIFRQKHFTLKVNKIALPDERIPLRLRLLGSMGAIKKY